jgi:hypothetical protein
MKNLLTPWRYLVLPLCLGSWMGWAGAQSLGTPAAEVWLGRPLEMTVPARFLSADAECVKADVFFGERRLPASQVRATVVGNDSKRVRIETDALIDEPIVTVSVRAGCASSITRNYTLLPELPSEAVIAAWNRQAQSPAVAAAAVPLRMATSTTPPTSPRVRAPRPTVVAQAAREVQAPAPAPRARSTRAPRKEPAAGPRLRLEPLEFEQQAALRVSSSLAEPEGNAAGRATAALLWQAINADPQELLRTSAMLQKLENDLQQMRRVNEQTRADVAALRRSIDEARPWYAESAVAQVLALLVLAAATAAGVMWFRARRELATLPPWYTQGASQPDDSALEPQFQAAGDAQAPASVEPAPVVRVDVPLETQATPTSMPLVMAQAAPAAPQPAAQALVEPTVAAPAPLRAAPRGVLRVETLAATFEEVEFLGSLGLATDAMDVLKAYLQDSASPAPVAFFELMRLCAQQDDAAAVAMVRRRYEKAYGMPPPSLQQVAAPTGLEALPQLSARITGAWGRPEVLDILEDALFSPPGPAAPSTLQAGRELLCLHDLALALAAETHAEDGEAAAPLAPWAHTDDAASALAATQGAVDASGGHHFALDFDLGASAPEPLPEQQGPDDDARLAPLLAEMKAAASREADKRRQEDEDAFSAAVSSERVPVSRY